MHALLYIVFALLHSATAQLTTPDDNGAVGLVRGAAAAAAVLSSDTSIAAAYGLSSARLAALLAADTDLAVAGGTALVCTCTGLSHTHEAADARLTAAVAQAAGAAAAEGASVQAAGIVPTGTTLQDPPVDATSVFKLHSRPGSKLKLYLDFNGCVVQNTAWNNEYGGPPIITIPAYSMDANPAFSATELAAMGAMWRIVAEDFSPWDIDVTTEDPGLAALARMNNTDQEYGMRVCVGGLSTILAPSGPTFGGVAYINVFASLARNEANPYWQPSFVFPGNLASGSVRSVSAAISHEVGHTLGLIHDGLVGGPSYYSGENTPGWGPIMGSPYRVQTATWDFGSYPGSNNRFQNDHEVISSYLPLVPDDAGNNSTLEGATPLCTPDFPCNGDEPPLITVAGSISIRSDMDVYTATLQWPGTVQARLTVAPPIIVTGDATFPGMRRSNLWARLRLLDATGVQLASVQHDIWSTTDISISYPAAAGGTFYFEVSPIGTSTVPVYGSIGSYIMTVQLPSKPPPPPSPPPPAPERLTLAPDTAVVQVSRSVVIDVLSNDIAGARGGTLTISRLGTATGGTARIVTVSGRQQVQFTARSAAGTGRLSYQARNSLRQVATGTVTVQIQSSAVRRPAPAAVVVGAAPAVMAGAAPAVVVSATPAVVAGAAPAVIAGAAPAADIAAAGR